MAKINAFGTQKGWIEVICGPMFAGKSEELLRRLNLLKYSEVEYLLFTPKIDTRVKQQAKSRDGRTISSITIDKSCEIIDYINEAKKNVQVIAIDEGQFFDDKLSQVCNYLANNGYIVLVAGLDMDFNCRPFKSMTELLVTAEKITKLTAICLNCGAKASFTERIKTTKNNQQIIVGDNEIYVAKCRHCHSSNNNIFFPFKKIKKLNK